MLKRTIRKVDDLFFGRALQRHRYKKWLAKELNEMERDLGYKFIVYYSKDTHNLLSKLCDKYGSDKGEIQTSGHPFPWRAQTYTDLYSLLFSNRRESVKKVFECGLGTNNPNAVSSMGPEGKPGASLRVWREFFPNAVIYGADIDRSILFEEDRIRTFYLDQLDPDTIRSFWEKIDVRDFDFMVDDGLHTFEAGSCLFEHSKHYLANRGVYVIEDVAPRDLLRYKKFFDGKEFVVDYDNKLFSIKKFLVPQ
jgi:hypothetical protein